jgi:hypothetical protein
MISRKRVYVGVNGNKREIFRSLDEPTQASHGDKYMAVIGPFITVRGAEYMRSHPFCETVYNAEMEARRI